MTDFFQNVADTLNIGAKKAAGAVVDFFGKPIVGGLKDAVTNVSKNLGLTPEEAKAQNTPTVQTASNTNANQNPPTKTLTGTGGAMTSSELSTFQKNAALMKQYGQGNYIINPDGSVSPKVSPDKQTGASDVIDKGAGTLPPVIDSSTYNPQSTPLNTTPADTSSSLDPIVAAALSHASSTYNSATDAIKTLQDQQNSLITKRATVTDPTQQAIVDQQQAFLKQQQDQIVPLQQQLNGYNQQVVDLSNRMNNELSSLQGQPGSKGFMSNEETAIRNKYAAPLAALSAETSLVSSQLQMVQGNVDMAYKGIDTAAKLMNFDITQQKDNFDAFLKNNDSMLSTLTSQQKSALDQLYSELSTAETENYNNNQQKLTWNVSQGLGLSASDLSKMSPEDVSLLAAQKHNDQITLDQTAERTDINYKLAQINNLPITAQEKQAQTQKVIAEANAAALKNQNIFSKIGAWFTGTPDVTSQPTTIEIQGSDGKTYTFNDQASADAFKAADTGK